jgi:hypothetical protein
MTRKSYAKLQRARAAAREKTAAWDDAVTPVLKFRSIPNRFAAGLSSPTLAWAVPDDIHSGEPTSCAPVVRKAPPSARCSIVATAFRAATSGAIRRQLEGKSALALVVLVPGPSWIRPVRDLFVSYFGEQWQAVAGLQLREELPWIFQPSPRCPQDWCRLMTINFRSAVGRSNRRALSLVRSRTARIRLRLRSF